ncbi:hypothetical protein [Bradyrhizobium sp. CW1]|uniref:hypothetical protein n=1 Tax=Bradyrhizobium sp. CW1 TaxID=2782686 RepID=UPI001FFE392F|nr:hypothetical protein [Bradyrhizobium sp. CW1]UPJ28999.1 hypothetical protein IVB54_08270 [Bradyrhizobium sp. CW1]
MAVEQFGGLLFSLILIRTIQFMHADDMPLIVEDVSAAAHDIRSINGTIMPGDRPLKSNQAIVICGGAARASGQLAGHRLLFTLGPCLLTALALEHANDPTGLGVEHLRRKDRLAATLIARLHWIWLIAGKDFVLKIAVHSAALAEDSLSTRVYTSSKWPNL